MVGYIGNQYLLSGEGLGFLAEEPNTVILKGGKAITVSVTGSGQAARVYAYDAKTGTTTELSSLPAVTNGALWYRLVNPSLIPTSDGGYLLVVERPTGRLGQDQLVMQKYAADGTPAGALKILDTTWIERAEVIATGTGFVTIMRDRTPDIAAGEPEYQIKFYTADGTLRSTIDFGAPFGSAQFAGQALANGNVAFAWRAADGLHSQIYRPDGTAVAPETVLPNTQTTGGGVATAALPNGGFVALFHNGTPDLYLQKYKADGSPRGTAIKLPVTPAQFQWGTTGLTNAMMDIAVMGDGSFVIAYHERESTNPLNSDQNIMIAVFSPRGTLLFGPEIAHTPVIGNQGDLELVTLRNGDVQLVFHDDNTKVFAYVESIQGVRLTAPDSLWEGGRQGENRTGTAGDDVMIGNGGNDTIAGAGGEDYILGGRGADNLSGGDRRDILRGEGGNDRLAGEGGNDTLDGGAGDDTLLGGNNDDHLIGGGGRDVIDGGRGNDSVEGGTVADDLAGGAGNDTIRGGGGNDTISGDGGDDSIFGDDGRDRIAGGTGNDWIDGGGGNDAIRGGGGLDVLRGGAGRDTLRGGAGDDALYGGDGADRLYGEGGADRFYDSAGDDTMRGGAGADTFLFYSTTFGQDVIRDFAPGEDVLDMRGTAKALNDGGRPAITVTDVAGGVMFAVDGGNAVLLEGVTTADLTAGTDYLIDPLF